MTPEHYISRVWVKDQDGTILHFEELKNGVISAEEARSSEFDVPAGTTELTPYELCNKHGLWEGAAQNVEDWGRPRKEEL